ncbi:helix-turn-helix domain-containing protein [Nocardia sp. R7R-8]|uniref:helix-turn-helix domain-containing protein n=1 Tax=Nocardia sp. R7R-8 TaxID=3459304 RepID=UPI00403E1339
MSGAARAKVALGARLRELRKDAGLDGRQLSTAAGWHWSKTSRIEHGKQMQPRRLRRRRPRAHRIGAGGPQRVGVPRYLPGG